MAAIVNVRRDVADKFYRYKMPLLLTKIEGKGNGIKTVFPNMADVARALSRPSSYPTKFFGCELGAQATFNDETERYIVNGAHDQNRMRDLLDVFIDKFVLCQSCKNPETELLVTKDDYILADCKACGHRGTIDMRHKLTTFILKHPPKKASKKSKKSAVAGADSIAGQPGQVDDGAESDDELTKKIEAGAAQIMSEEQAARLIAEREQADDWSLDTSPEAVAARVAGLDAKLQSSLVLGDDDDDEAGGPYGLFGEWVKENKGKVSDAEIYKQAEEEGIAKKHKTLVVLFQALFDEKVNTELKDHLPLLAKMTTSEKHQKSLLGGLERLLGEQHPECIPEVPKVLMQLYQADILDEELLQSWGTHVSKKYVPKDVSKKVRKASEPFLKWLSEADSDSDEEDDA
ncbi:hypothetical protein JCM21900_004791 [Sporobolomyces salmonicolor]